MNGPPSPPPRSAPLPPEKRRYLRVCDDGGWRTKAARQPLYRADKTRTVDRAYFLTSQRVKRYMNPPPVPLNELKHERPPKRAKTWKTPVPPKKLLRPLPRSPCPYSQKDALLSCVGDGDDGRREPKKQRGKFPNKNQQPHSRSKANKPCSRSVERVFYPSFDESPQLH